LSASPAITGFAPIAAGSARLLILGSMPGVMSLAAGQYYAHPRNAFWPIMAGLCGFDVALPYARRTRALERAGIAVWDVLHRCERRGSLDSAIDRRSCVANELPAFLAAHPRIRRVAFNGAGAEKLFGRWVLPRLAADDLEFVRLPSTSPAHTLPLARKAAAWRRLLAD